MTSNGEIIVERCGAVGRIRLNRPKALNSLTLGMVSDIAAALDQFERDDRVFAVVVTGEGERGFCAGGDIRALYESGRADGLMARRFWRDEYRLNDRISRYPKLYVAVVDGIAMGGGVGISAYGSHRIVTERTRLAMPETGIGFFPDVGASWLLSQQNRDIGLFLALTGEEIGAADAIAADLADIYLHSAQLPDLLRELQHLSDARDLDDLLTNLAERSDAAPLAKLESHRDMIERVFSFGTIEEILAALERESGSCAARIRNVLLARSPTSLKLTLQLMRLGRQSSLRDCLEREYAATSGILRGYDFYEGVRAAVIDKDRSPRWRPDRIELVTNASLDEFRHSPLKPLFR